MKPLYAILISAAVLLQGAPGHAGGDILDKVPALQKTARRANGGALGCGSGAVTLVTSKGEVAATCGLDPIHVFGPKIKVSDIHVLLAARVEANRSGKKGPMSGDVSDLCYVCLSTLSLARDPASIPVVVPLLKDRNEVVRRWAGIALKAIGESDPVLQKQIEAMTNTAGVDHPAAGNTDKPDR